MSQEGARGRKREKMARFHVRLSSSAKVFEGSSLNVIIFDSVQSRPDIQYVSD